MRWSLALFGWLLVQAFAGAQDSTQRDLHEMHRLHQDPGRTTAGDEDRP